MTRIQTWILAGACTMAAVAVAVTVGCSSGTPDDPREVLATAPEAGPTLPFGERFATTSFERSGREVTVLDGEQLEVSFTEEDGEMSIGWDSGCNTFGGRLESPDEVEFRQTVSTAVGCPGPQLEQDGVIARFFESDPEWRLEGEQLILSSGETTIELEPKDPASEAESPGDDPEMAPRAEELECEFGPGQIVGTTYDVDLSSAGEPKAFLALRDFLRDEDLGVAAYEFDRYGSGGSVSFGLVLDEALVAEVATIEGRNGWLTSGYRYCRGVLGDSRTS